MSSGFYDPWREGPWSGLARLRQELDDAFHGGRPRAPWSAGNPFPPVNLYESGDAYVLTAEIPGLRAEDVEVAVEGDKVTLRGERRIEYPADEQTSLHRRERQAGRFRRTVRLPVAIDADKAEAAYKSGVLLLRIPKAPEARPRRVEVRAGS